MATSLRQAIRELERAREDLAKHEAKGVPDWYIAMFRTEVECCESEVEAWKRISSC